MTMIISSRVVGGKHQNDNVLNEYFCKAGNFQVLHKHKV